MSSGLCELWWRNQNLVERSNRLELIKFGFEAQDGMAATWGVGTYLVWSLSVFIALLVGLFTLPVYPIVGALLVMGGMALQLIPSRVCAERQNPRMNLVKKAMGGGPRLNAMASIEVDCHFWSVFRLQIIHQWKSYRHLIARGSSRRRWS